MTVSLHAKKVADQKDKESEANKPHGKANYGMKKKNVVPQSTELSEIVSTRINPPRKNRGKTPPQLAEFVVYGCKKK